MSDTYIIFYTALHSADPPGFENSLDIEQFHHKEVVCNTNIGPNILGVSHDEDAGTVNITFDSALDSAEQIIFYGLISNHIPEPVIGKYLINISMPTSLVDLTTYTTLTTFNFPGTLKLNNITNIKIIGFMEEDGTSYDVKIRDMINVKDVCTKNLTNETEAISDLGNITDLPIGESIFEIQAKINGSSVAYIKNINIYHN